ncbi:hypothetical protein [Yoonia sp. I 8.24]|uniref:hypothetical protein n=1 Tax=Yoonia sp. I 8.24 TaxID=1537229 RepID=UPI001EDEA3A2|nr:hypothetical protein [Yoonia sp. I 8.24]MCG3268611.1 hypothetical protein [Yoonia sp. I 8.24]
MLETTRMETLDRIVLCLIMLLLLYSATIFASAYVSGAKMGAWVWERHQNQFSWYSRPLFIIPAAYYAYRHKIWHIVGFMALLATSLFWFNAPAVVSSGVSDYLEWEKKLFLLNENMWPLFALIVSVVLFLTLLFYAFWQRNLWIGLAIINLGTALKIVVSVSFGQDAGMAAIVPSLSSLFVINLFAWLLWRLKGRNSRGIDSTK